ncbi:MAG: hypothetical protein FD126_3519, partial [Elusimicrobia bacterium]
MNDLARREPETVEIPDLRKK